MAFDGTYIWRAGATGPQPSSTIRRIDPVAQTSVAVFTIPYVSLGIAWDGSGLWISEFTTNGIIARYDTLGNPTGESFHTAEGFQNGGLAFDTSDGTLFMGSWGRIYHYTTTGAVLGYFDPYGGFIDGLEFEPEQPVGIGPSWPAAERLSLSVRPNPSSAPFEIAVNAGGPVQFRILDISGRVVKEMTMPANE